LISPLIRPPDCFGTPFLKATIVLQKRLRDETVNVEVEYIDPRKEADEEVLSDLLVPSK
jgi:hypothetical protein